MTEEERRLLMAAIGQAIGEGVGEISGSALRQIIGLIGVMWLRYEALITLLQEKELISDDELTQYRSKEDLTNKNFDRLEEIQKALKESLK